MITVCPGVYDTGQTSKDTLMLMEKWVSECGGKWCECSACQDQPAIIRMHGYARPDTNGRDVAPLELCRNCALQLLRKLSEDLCEAITGDRHG
jgi:hypothetical protein